MAPENEEPEVENEEAEVDEAENKDKLKSEASKAMNSMTDLVRGDAAAMGESAKGAPLPGS